MTVMVVLVVVVSGDDPEVRAGTSHHTQLSGRWWWWQLELDRSETVVCVCVCRVSHYTGVTCFKPYTTFDKDTSVS